LADIAGCPMKRLLLALSALLVAGAVTFTTFAQQAPPAAQSRPSPQKVEHKQTWTYNHGNKNPDVAPIPLIDGMGPEGRPNFGGCDAADATMGRNGCGSTAPLWPTPPTPPPPATPAPSLCSDTNASNFGGPLPCVCKTGFKKHPTGGCIRELQPPPVPPPPPPPPPPKLCLDPVAMNYYQTAPCQYCPPGTTWNGWQCQSPPKHCGYNYPPSNDPNCTCLPGEQKTGYWNGSLCQKPYIPPPPPKCTGGQVSNGWGCVCPANKPNWVNGQCAAPAPQPAPKCMDTKATNYGGALPCKYPPPPAPPKQPPPPVKPPPPPPPPVCKVPGPGYGLPLPCKECAWNEKWNGSACIKQQCGPNMQGTWPACQPIPPPPPSCPKGQFWNGTRCVGSSPPPPLPPCHCNGDYWPSSSRPAQMHTNRCGNLVNWDGRGWYCV